MLNQTSRGNEAHLLTNFIPLQLVMQILHKHQMISTADFTLHRLCVTVRRLSLPTFVGRRLIEPSNLAIIFKSDSASQGRWMTSAWLTSLNFLVAYLSSWCSRSSSEFLAALFPLASPNPPLPTLDRAVWRAWHTELVLFANFYDQ